jgi:hypothetical protein
MEINLPSDSELDALAAQVDEQFNALCAASVDQPAFRGVTRGVPGQLPAAPVQQAVIEKATGEPFETFWQKYKRHARRDLCLPGGLLYEQWQKWKDMQSKDLVKVAYGALAGVGIGAANVPAVAVAASVFVLNVVAKIGIEAVCEGCAEEEAAREKARKKAAEEKLK